MSDSQGEGGDGESGADAGGGEDLNAAFSSRVLDEGGQTKLRLESEATRMGRSLAELPGSAGRALRTAVDFDGERAAPSVSRREGDLVGWRSTLAFLGGVVVLATCTALTTDFGPS